ncbi:hypothetical protein ACJJTC_019258 [Scirpophaga incertulas]
MSIGIYGAPMSHDDRPQRASADESLTYVPLCPYRCFDNTSLYNAPQSTFYRSQSESEIQSYSLIVPSPNGHPSIQVVLEFMGEQCITNDEQQEFGDRNVKRSRLLAVDASRGRNPNRARRHVLCIANGHPTIDAHQKIAVLLKSSDSAVLLIFLEEECLRIV